LIYYSPSGAALTVFPNKPGGIATINTPEIVKYYVNQAYRAQLGNAFSGAMAMYRSALAELLEEQGYSGRLPQQILALETARTNKTGSKWALNLNTEVLKLFKEIGDSQMHPSEMPKLQALDATFMQCVFRGKRPLVPGMAAGDRSEATLDFISSFYFSFSSIFFFLIDSPVKQNLYAL